MNANSRSSSNGDENRCPPCLNSHFGGRPWARVDADRVTALSDSAIALSLNLGGCGGFASWDWSTTKQQLDNAVESFGVHPSSLEAAWWAT